MALTNRLVAVDVYTASYRVVGKVQVGNTGLVGLLNDETTSYMRVHEATLARLHMPTKLAARYEFVELTKRGIHAVCVPTREDLGPLALVRGGFSRTLQYHVVAVSQVFEFEGLFNWAGHFDPAAILVKGTSDFLAFYDGVLQAVLFPNLRVEAPGMLVNRRKIDIFVHAKEPTGRRTT